MSLIHRPARRPGRHRPSPPASDPRDQQVATLRRQNVRLAYGLVCALRALRQANEARDAANTAASRAADAVAEADRLRTELLAARAELANRDAVSFPPRWQRGAAW